MHLRSKTMYRVFVTALAVLAVGFSTVLHAADKKADVKKVVKITYDEHIKPIFRSKCFSCHNPNKKSGDLDLTNFTNLMQGGGSGEVIEPGSVDDSYLYSLVTHESEPIMPPMSEKMPKEILSLIAAWINGGALENAGSKSLVTKPKMDLALKIAPTEKPSVIPMPGRLSKEPVVRTKLKTATTALATSPWAPLVAVGGQKQVLLYHSQTLEPMGVFPFPEGVPHVVKFSRNGKLLLAGGGRGGLQGGVVVWDIKTGERIIEVGDELDTVLAADISSDQSLIALGGPNKVVRIYSTSDGKLLHEITKHTDWICSIEFSPDSVLLATGDRSSGVFVWEAQTAREYLSLRGHSKMITDFSWRIDSNVLASCSEDASIRLWEMENGRQLKSWGAHGGGTASVEFTRDGRIVSAGRDRVTKIWDQNGKALRSLPAFADLALAVTHCDETNRVIAGDWTGSIRVWNAADGKQLGELTSNPPKLAERLDLATKQLTANQAQNQKLVAAYQAAIAVSNKANTDLAAAQKSVVENQKQLQANQNTVKQTQTAIAQLTAQQQAAAKVIATLQPQLAPLKVSLTNAQAAATKATGDKELAAVVAQLKAQVDKKTAAHASAAKTAAEKKTAADKAKIQLAATQKQVVAFTAALTAAQKKVVAITPTVKPAAVKAAAAKTAADAAAAAFAASRKEVARWKDEINLVVKLDALALRNTKLNDLALVHEEARVAAEKVNTELAAANQLVQAAQQKSVAATAALAAVQKTLTQLTAEHTAATQAAGTLEGVLPILKSAADQGKAAATKVKGDKDLADAAAKLKTVFDRKTAELATTKKTIAAKAAAVAKTKPLVAAQQKQATDTAAALANAGKPVVAITARLKQAQQKTATAKATMDAAQKEIETLRAAL